MEAYRSHLQDVQIIEGLDTASSAPLKLRVPATSLTELKIHQIRKILREHPGESPVYLHIGQGKVLRLADEADQRQMARAIVRRELDVRARTALRLGEPQISEVEEDEVTESVLAAAFSTAPAIDRLLERRDVTDLHVNGSNVQIDMSLTSPGCPSGPEIMGEAEQQLRTIPGIGDVTMNLVWSPPWTPERIEPRVRAYMGF